MGDGDLDLRYEFAEFLRDFIQVGNPRANIENLTSPEMLPHDRLANHDLIERHHERTHGKPVYRGRSDKAHFLHPR